MRIILYSVIISIFLASCTTGRNTTLSFSSIFTVSLQPEQLYGSTILYSDELNIKLHNGDTISGMAISYLNDNLPPTFDMRQYPEILLGISDTELKDAELNRLFTNSRNELAYLYDMNTLKVQDKDGVIYYSICKDLSCVAYIVEKSITDQIFTIHTTGYNRKRFIDFIHGAVNVK